MEQLEGVIKTLESTLSSMQKTESIITAIYKNHMAKYNLADNYLAETLIKNGKITEKDRDIAARLYSINEMRKEYKNQAKVLVKADKLFEHLNEEVKESAKEPDEDWTNYFLDKVKIISNDRMQDLWACILAQECLQEGTFRKVMLDRLALLDKNSAMLFQLICSLTYQVKVSDGRGYLIPLYIRNDTLQEMVQNPDICLTEEDAIQYQTYFCIENNLLSPYELEDELEILNEIGLISLANEADENDIYSTDEVMFSIEVEDEEIVTLNQFDESREIYYVVTGNAIYTKFGLELFHILKKQNEHPIWFPKVLRAFFDFHELKHERLES